MAEELTIQSGRIVRPGFYRAPDGSGVRYASTIATSSENDCVFCPELTQHITYRDDYFTVIQAQPSYAHFDAQEVITHELLIPNVHVSTLRALGARARRRIDEFIGSYEDQTPENLRFQEYTRCAGNPSKSIEHLHTHLFRLSLRPISSFSFDSQRGVKTLTFTDLSSEEIARINQSRTDHRIK